MPEKILELAAEEYLAIQKIVQQSNIQYFVPFQTFLRNWLHRENYREYIKFV